MNNDKIEKLEYENIFDSIIDDPVRTADLKLKSELLSQLINKFGIEDWSQNQIADALEITKDRALELLYGKISLFSSDDLRGYTQKVGLVSDH